MSGGARTVRAGVVLALLGAIAACGPKRYPPDSPEDARSMAECETGRCGTVVDDNGGPLAVYLEERGTNSANAAVFCSFGFRPPWLLPTDAPQRSEERFRPGGVFFMPDGQRVKVERCYYEVDDWRGTSHTVAVLLFEPKKT